MKWKKQLRAAIKHAGSQSRLAARMGCSQAKINWLMMTATQISADDAVAIHRATNGAVLASSLRPDLWTDAHPIPALADVGAASSKTVPL